MATGKKKGKQASKGKAKGADTRKSAAYWRESPDNLAVLTGLALQCRTLDDLAAMLGVHPVTVRTWRTKYEDIREAIDIGREQADAAVVHATFSDAVTADGQSRKLWWQYRIATKETAYAVKQYGVQQPGNEVVPVIIINRKGAKDDE